MEDFNQPLKGRLKEPLKRRLKARLNARLKGRLKALLNAPLPARLLSILLGVLLFCGTPILVPAQSLEEIDALFDSPEAGTIEGPSGAGEAPGGATIPRAADSSSTRGSTGSGIVKEAEEPPSAAPTERKVKEAPPPDLLAEFTREPLSVSGSISTAIGGLAGFTELPPFDKPVQETLRSLYRNLDFSGYAEFSNSLTFRARPDRDISLQGTVETSYPGFGLSISELFLTYVLWDRYFFRIGKQAITWGNGRIYSDTNLTSGAEGGYAFKLTVPVSTAAFTAVVMDQPAWRYTSEPGAADLSYAAQLTLPVGGVEFLLEALYPSQKRRDGGFAPRGVVGAKTTLWSVDLFHESMLTTRREYVALSGFFKEWGDPKIQLYGEHRVRVTLPEWLLVDLPWIGDRFAEGPLVTGSAGGSSSGGSGSSSPADHQTSLNFLWKRFPLPNLDFGIRWNHAWRDHSGYIVPGIKINNPFPHGSIALALPIYWGTSASVIASEFSGIDPRYRKLSLGAKISLSVGYF